MSQLSFASLRLGTKQLKSERFLDEMERIIPWDLLLEKIRPHYYKEGAGRKPYDLKLMLKIHCLQQWYQLSDPGMEEAIYDRVSFQRFLRLDSFMERVPDETTILSFRHLLEEHHLGREIFEAVNQKLIEKGLLLKEGTIADATLVASPSSTKNEGRKRDPEMGSTRKNNQWTFGMKIHVGADMHSGLYHSCEVTAANVSDRSCFANVLHGNEKAVFGDKGYWSDKDKHYARDAGIFWGVIDKKKPKKGDLSERQKRRNRRLASIRAKVEHGFRIIKELWGFRKVRYKGLEKNENKTCFMLGLANLYMVRNKLIGVGIG